LNGTDTGLVFVEMRSPTASQSAPNRRNRFEPAIRFVLDAKHGAELLVEGNPEGNRDFLKKIDSNLRIAEKALTVDFKNPWQYVVDFNFTRASARADNEFSLTGEKTGGEGGIRTLFAP